MVTEQNAVELLETFRICITRARRSRIFHVLLGTILLAASITLFATQPNGRPMANEMLALCGFIVLGAFAFVAKRIAEFGTRLQLERETESAIEQILEDDPQLRSKFNRDVITSVFENSLYE